jgi:hypothetical protein
MTPETELMCGGVVWPALGSIVVPVVLGAVVARVLRDVPLLGLVLGLVIGVVTTLLWYVGWLARHHWTQWCLAALILSVASCGECVARHLEERTRMPAG